jgi:hypothetical protein
MLAICRNPSSTFPGKLAYLLNTTQPLISIVLLSIAFQKIGIPFYRLFPAIILCCIYSIVTIVETTKQQDFDIKPDNNCVNLNYKWWKPLTTNLYFVTLIFTFLAIPYLGYSILSIALFLGTIFITTLFIHNYCKPGSLSCWSVASAGFCTFLYYLLFDKTKSI